MGIYVANFEKCSDQGESLKDLIDNDGWIVPEMPANADTDEDKKQDEQEVVISDFDDVVKIIANFKFSIINQTER